MQARLIILCSSDGISTNISDIINTLTFVTSFIFACVFFCSCEGIEDPNITINGQSSAFRWP